MVANQVGHLIIGCWLIISFTVISDTRAYLHTDILINFFSKPTEREHLMDTGVKAQARLRQRTESTATCTIPMLIPTVSAGSSSEGIISYILNQQY